MRILLLIFCSVLLGPVFGQSYFLRKLDNQIKNSITDFKGDIGFYIYDLKSGKSIGYNQDTIFPTASIVKIPIMIGVMDRIQKGELKYHQKLIYKDSLLYEGEDILGSFKNGETIDLSKVLMLMLTTSDNTASLWLQSLAGTGTVINGLMDGLGMEHTKVNSRTPGRETAKNEFGWGQTTPREMAMLFSKIAAKEIGSPATADKMLRVISRNYWDEEGLSMIPPDVYVASKNGAVNASRSEVMYVKGNRQYIFSIFTKNNKDQSWNPDNEAWVLTRKISEMVWNHFNR